MFIFDHEITFTIRLKEVIEGEAEGLGNTTQ